MEDGYAMCRYFSTFSGIGGFELGIQNAMPNAQCVGYSEINTHAITVYRRQFPDHRFCGDISYIDGTNLPDFELFVGGFPCQSFSIAGKRGGFADTRGTLFFEIARIVREKQPRLLLLENVKGLLSHDQGRTFVTVISTLDELGYDCQWQVLNSADFGVPQSRERVFIVGHLRGQPRPDVFPLEQPEETHSVHFRRTPSTSLSGARVERKRQEASRCAVIPDASVRGYQIVTACQVVNLAYLPSNFRRGRVSGTAFTLDTTMQQYTLDKEGELRRLTPMECERLQGFPDGWTEGISDTQRYKCLGNAVTVNVIRAIVSKLSIA